MAAYKGAGRRSALWQAPAVQACLVLCAAFVVVLLLGRSVGLVFGIGGFSSFSLLSLALLHGAVAAGIAGLRRMAWWWVLMLFCFPPAAVLVFALQLPPALFLLVFLFLLSLFWSTFRSQVPFYPSGIRVWETVLDLLPVGRPLRVIDIGSGLGGAVLHLARRRQDSLVLGIELAPLPWLVSHARAWLTRSRGGFIRGDYRQLDFADYDVIFAYLSPAAMGALWHKARAEMRAGSLLLSYEFLIEEVPPDIAMQARANGAVLYGWQM